MTTTTNPKCWVNPTPPRREESDTPQMAARWYQPNTATFTTRDTLLGSIGGPTVNHNRHTYANNNPLTYWDPTGRRAILGDDLNLETPNRTAKDQATTASNYAKKYLALAESFASGVYGPASRGTSNAVSALNALDESFAYRSGELSKAEFLRFGTVLEALRWNPCHQFDCVDPESEDYFDIAVDKGFWWLIDQGSLTGIENSWLWFRIRHQGVEVEIPACTSLGCERAGRFQGVDNGSAREQRAAQYVGLNYCRYRVVDCAQWVDTVNSNRAVFLFVFGYGSATATRPTHPGSTNTQYVGGHATKPGVPQAEIDAIGGKISPQAQARHIEGTPQWTARGEGGYFKSPADAQAVLDAVKSGQAQVIGRTANGQLIVRYDGVTGFNNNAAAGFVDQPTNVFIVKGTLKVSVVPTSPGATAK